MRFIPFVALLLGLPGFTWLAANNTNGLLETYAVFLYVLATLGAFVLAAIKDLAGR
jgi:hypothetical protein